MSEIDFYFSIGSTYTYLSVTRILDVEKQHQVKFNWKPFSVRAIMKEMNNIPFPKDKMNKVNYMWSCLLYTSPSPRDYAASRMPSSA